MGATNVWVVMETESGEVFVMTGDPVRVKVVSDRSVRVKEWYEREDPFGQWQEYQFGEPRGTFDIELMPMHVGKVADQRVTDLLREVTR